MIDSLTVWHGPVYGLYAKQARAALSDLGTLVIDCSESSPKSLDELIPEDNILADDTNGLWLRGLHHWKADEVTKAVKFLDKHSLNYDIVVTMDKAPTKLVI